MNMNEVIRGAIPFIPFQLLCLRLVMAFPSMVS
jgi:TRAP-type mannitol/chloroaromatic compound transport system permease large subunit